MVIEEMFDVASEERCSLHSGAPRSGPHVDRKLSAAEAIVTKRSLRDPLPTDNPKYVVVSPVTNSDLEVCRFPIARKLT